MPAFQHSLRLDRFYRINGAEASSSGLGLAIVKAIADLHGATLALARSQRLGGLRVVVALPARAFNTPIRKFAHM